MINVVVCLISADFYKDEKYALSTHESKLTFPSFPMENFESLNNQVYDRIFKLFIDPQFSKEYVYPNFIDINNIHISKLFDSSTILNFLYGCSCPKLKPTDTLFWCPFSMIDETINKELGIISHVIEKSF